MLVMIS